MRQRNTCKTGYFFFFSCSFFNCFLFLFYFITDVSLASFMYSISCPSHMQYVLKYQHTHILLERYCIHSQFTYTFCLNLCCEISIISISCPSNMQYVLQYQYIHILLERCIHSQFTYTFCLKIYCVISIIRISGPSHT